ncbi:P-loop containing nucleoside triphosphate hydrolase [Pseudocohnilembus persalinus]|uniref:p-loop containing nucleoside triphosphate hydrolase n=1 Tax=Pseudocohnilembus persalinus TaxID=266149 RepID=A0A0V0Q7F9_PSEPJ|nr:P-loop containing nucleoside triphosphate hydrolase [Pseudocohnilembus persalinus]|eukprot:KRW98126.1 P-loop containing nucleoside triphosphate hydrolase [Pseudocohnilembus persalinus]
MSSQIQENQENKNFQNEAIPKVVPQQDVFKEGRYSLDNKSPKIENIYQITEGQKSSNIDISFQNITYQVEIEKKNKETGKLEKQNRVILNNLSGVCKAGEITAIMGASGAGKTSLLNILCKRIVNGGKVQLDGQIKANELEYRYDNFNDFASYIMQDDRLIDTLTVRETLMFAAKLKIKGEEEQLKKVNQIIRDLKLDRCQHSQIGGKTIKGISGGERKRTSIAFELVTDPQVMFLDEPTSGLDSFTAFLVINQLKQMAREHNRTIVFTIHQPSSDIWTLFDRYMLLVQGKFIYQGSGGQSVVDHFSKMNLHCPVDSNPADYLMSICHKENKQNVDNYPKYFDYYDKNLQNQVNQDLKIVETSQINKTTQQFNFFYQLWQILLRTIKIQVRNPAILRARTGQTIVLSILVSLLFYQLPDGQDDPNNVAHVADFSGFLFFQSVNLIMLSIMPVVLTFPQERGVFLKEENSKMYSIGAYFVGRSLIELPFLFIFPTVQSIIQFYMVGLTQTVEVFFKYVFANICASFCGNSLGILIGSLFSDPKVASSMMPIIMLPLMMFSGLFGNREDMWDGLSWIEYISPFKYVFDAQIHNEFKESYFQPNPIETLNLNIGYWWSCVLLIIMFVFYRLIAFGGMVMLKSRLQ